MGRGLANYLAGESEQALDDLRRAALLLPPNSELKSDAEELAEFIEDELGKPPKSEGVEAPAMASGTGIIVSPRGQVLTNHHVVERCTRIEVRRPGELSVVANVLHEDAANDLALLKVDVLFSADDVAGIRTGPPVRNGKKSRCMGSPLWDCSVRAATSPAATLAPSLG